MSRYREERDDPTTSPVVVTGDGAGTLMSFTAPNGVKTITDVVTSKFRSKIKQGVIINNPCTITDSNIPVGGGSRTYDRQWSDGSTWNNVVSGPLYSWTTRDLPLPYDLDDFSNLDLVAMAKLKALSNIDSTPYSFAEDLAEIRTTVKHLFSRGRDLKDLNTSLSRAVKYLKKQRHRKNPATIEREISQLYLEYRFAISPLIRSIADLIEAANEKLGSRPDRLTARGFEENSSTSRSSIPISRPPYKAHAERELSEKVGAGILYSVTNPLSGFRFKYGLRNKDIPVTMWAIVPYSFMVDRVFNISQALRAITNLWDPDVHIHAAWCRTSRETRTVYNVNGSAVGSDSNNPQQWHFSGTDLPIESFEYVRVPWTPSIADAIPTPTWVKLVDSFTKIADITALAHVNVKMGR